MNRWAASIAVCLVLSGSQIGAQSSPPVDERVETAQPRDGAKARLAQFLAGGALGLGLHESAHAVTASIVDANPGVKKVSFGPIPFFAITHDEVSPAREYVISASGFWMQHAVDEWLLTTRPHLRQEHAPLAKGVLAFNILASVAYSTAAFGTFGPYERDTRAMADALDVSEPWVGATILAPAALDAWRYFKPESRWAAWTSRAAKLGAVLIVIRAAN